MRLLPAYANTWVKNTASFATLQASTRAGQGISAGIRACCITPTHSNLRYTRKQKPKKIDPVIFVESDFTRLIAQVSSESINVCENYEEWRNCGFALADQFGEGGRDYFHVISAASATYRPTSQAANSRMVDKQYTACLNKGARYHCNAVPLL